MDKPGINHQLSLPTLPTLPILKNTDQVSKSGTSRSSPSFFTSVPVQAKPADTNKDLSLRKCTESNITSDKVTLFNIIRAIKITMNYAAPHTFHHDRGEMEIHGGSLFDGKYDLRENCINICIPLFKALCSNEAIIKSGYRIGLSVIKEAGQDATTYFDSSDTLSISGLVANSYLVFERSEDGKKLVLDPSIAATLLKAKPTIMTFAELKDQIRSNLEQLRNEDKAGRYSFPGGGLMPIRSGVMINRFIYRCNPAPDLEQATDLLFNAMYGENLNPRKTESTAKTDKTPIQNRDITT